MFPDYFYDIEINGAFSVVSMWMQCSANQLWPSELLQRSSSPHVRGRSCSGLTGQRLGQGRHSKHTTVCSDSVAESYGLMEETDLADADTPWWRVISEQKNALQRNILHLDLWSVHRDSFLLSRREVVYLTVPSCWRSWWAFLFFSDLSRIPNEEILVNDFFASCRFLKAILEALNTSVYCNIINMFPTNALSSNWWQMTIQVINVKQIWDKCL